MNQKFKSYDDFQEQIISDKELQEAFKKDPIDTIQRIRINPLNSDKWIYRVIVISLGLTIISTIIGVLILIGTDQINDDKNVPTILTAIGSAAIGALAGLLVVPPKNEN